jgi:hypothetical protein
MTTKDITFLELEEWIRSYSPVMRDGHPKLYDNNRAMNAVRLVPTTRVWTLIDEDGYLFIVNGSRFVNRLGYYITARNWEEDKDYQVDIEDA